MTKFEQILRILNFIEQGELCRIADLAEKLKVHPRTVYRYIASLRTAGFPIHYDETKKGYVFSGNYQLRKSLVSAEEHLALGLSKGLLGSALGDTFENTIEQVKDKCLRHTANLQARNRMESVFMMPGSAQEGRNLSIIMDLANACIEYQRVLLTWGDENVGK